MFLLCSWRTETSEFAILQFFHVYSQFITILLGLETGTDAALFLFVIVCKIHADLRAILILAYVPLKRAPVNIFKGSPVQSGGVALLSIPQVIFVLGQACAALPGWGEEAGGQRPG